MPGLELADWLRIRMRMEVQFAAHTRHTSVGKSSQLVEKTLVHVRHARTPVAVSTLLTYAHMQLHRRSAQQELL